MDGARHEGSNLDVPSDPRIAELETALERVRAENAELSARLRAAELESPDPVLTVDGAGEVVARSGPWPWTGTEIVAGDSLASAFDPESAETLVALAASGWLGVAERRFTLRDGRRISMSVRPARDGLFRIALHDVTARHVLDDASERRRRMRALAELSGSLARELTDPMSIVQGRLELLLELGVTDPGTVRRHLDVALGHARRVTATLRNLRLVGFTPTPHAEAVGVDRVVADALDLLGPRRDRVLVKIEPADLLCGGDGPLATRVVASLLRQALEAAGRGTVHLRARKQRGAVTVRIGPSGRASGDELAPTEESALDRTLIASIGGEFVARHSTHGLQFDMVLPAPPTRRARRRPLRGRIAVVGSAALHEAVTGLLCHDGYAFVCAHTGDEGLTAVGNGALTVDAVVTELLLDGALSGLTLAETVISRHPALEGRVLLVSEAPVVGVGAPVVPMTWPLGRGDLLEALGHRVRR